MKTFLNFGFLISLLILASCNGGGKAFESLEDPNIGNTSAQVLEPVKIDSFTPTTSPSIITNTSSLFLGVTVSGNVGTVNYTYLLDDSQTLKTGTSPFFTLNGSVVPSGLHAVKVTASNGQTSDSKIFQVKKNSPTQIVSFNPAVSGTSILCGTGTQVFSAVMNDADSDGYVVSWELDNSIVTSSTPFTNVLTTIPISQFTYSPDCSQVGSHVLSVKVFDGYELTTKTWTYTVNSPPSTPGAVQILAFTPTANPVIITQGQSLTFAVTTNDGVGPISYEFLQDNSTVLQTGSSSYHTVNGTSMTPGYHSLKVKASNSSSFAEKTFNIRKNTPPNVLSYTPSFTGTSFTCTGGSVSINADFTDFDADTVSVKWKLDNVLVTGSTAFVTTSATSSNAILNFTPDCTKVGFHTLKLILSDGFEETSSEWSVSVTNPPAPPGNVSIVTFTPTQSPVVMTDSTSATFAVSVQDGAGAVTYEFKKDYSTVLQNTTTPFMVLAGTNFTPGLHTLKVKATNSVSNDEKIFNIRKNTPPSVLSSSPAATGSSINCGQDTLTFNATNNDVDNDSFTMTWEIDSTLVTSSTPFITTNSTTNSTQLAYSPDCTSSGYHTLNLKIFDGYETTTKSWTFNVINPTVEAIASYFPTSNSLISYSTESAKAFTVSGTGIGSLTYKWKVDGVLKKTDSSVSTSTLNLDLSTVTTGNHTIEVVLTDSITTNDPTTPAKQTWTLYKNEKPRFVSLSPATALKINISTQKSITASIEDAADTFSVSISKGPLSCNPLSECGLSGVVKPTTTGVFSSTFTPTTSFLGNNAFTIKVTDSHGESIQADVELNVNYFSDVCNNLAPGRICTLSGLPGMGSNINVQTQANRVRVNPSWITMDDLGNWFFTDHSTHTVWYYNVSNSPVSLLGVTVPAKNIYVVAGTGVPGIGGNGSFARKLGLNFNIHGGGLAWDSTNKELFIADYNNNRVIKVGTDGRAYVVCGGGGLTTQGALAKDSKCAAPVDLEIDVTNRRLYVSQQSDHVVKLIDITNSNYSTWPSYIVGGIYGSGSSSSGSSHGTTFNPSGYLTAPTAGRFNQPWGLYLDTADQILYLTEYNSCRIRAIGLPGSTTRTFGSVSIAPNTLPLLTTGSCTNPAPDTNAPINTINFGKPVDLVVNKVAGGLAGIFVSDRDRSSILYLNNAISAAGIGNQTVTPGNGNLVFGNGTASPTNPPSGKTTAVVTPIGIYKNGSTLYAGIRGNSIIRSLDLGVVNGALTNFLGGTPRAGYSGNTPLDSKLVTYNQPLSLLYRETGDLLFVADSTNYMIRSLNLTTGMVQDFIGTGAAAVETQPNTVTTSTRLASPRAMTYVDDFFVYADINNNCFLRAFNSRTSDQNIMGSLVLQNRTNVIAGYPSTCGAFVGTSPLDVTNTNAKLDNPYGIAFDTSSRNMYIASNNSHCIMKLTESGTLAPIIGSCGSAGTSGSPIYGGAYNDPSVLLRFPTELIMDPMPGYEGNFFFADHTDTSKAHIKYVNLTNNSPVPFPGSITVSKNNMETVFGQSSTPGFIRAIAAYDDWFCYSSGTTTSGNGNNTITCRNRTTSATKVFGSPGEGGISPEGSDEGALIDDVSSTVTLAVPSGLAFNKEGDLIISEQSGHVIRMIKKWF